MIYSFILPDSGEGIHESEIVTWDVKPGDKVEEDDTLVEIQSDKAVVALPSPVSGVVKKLLFEEGDVPKVGDAIVEIEISDDEIQQFMEELFNKPGASEFLTPREVIRDFLNILNIIRQNPTIDKSILFGELEVSDERPEEFSLDSIEEL